MSRPFPLHTVETAPESVKPALAKMQKSMGFIPSMLAKFAEAPALLDGYQSLAPFFDKTSLTPEERTVVLMAASFRHDCDFCMTAHSWGARRQGTEEAIIAALRDGTPLPDEKLEALRLFTLSIVENRGAVSESDKDAFFASGYGTQQALEVVLGVGIKTMTNYTNALAHTPPNPQFGDAIWKKRRDKKVA